MTEGISLPLLYELYDYNYWARDQHLRACASLTQEQFLRPMNSSFSSLRDTLAHLVGAEWLWLEWWHGRSPQAMLPAEDFPNLEAVRRRWSEMEAQVREFLATLNEESLVRQCSLVAPGGRRHSFVMWRTLLHLVNHQSYHRGQVATLLRQLGVHPPEVDFLAAHTAGLR